MTPSAFLDIWTKPIVIGTLLNEGLFPSVAMAQLILETGWGESTLMKEANNPFNIKADSSWQGKRIQHYDPVEGSNDYYRVYNTLSDGIADRNKFLKENPRYTIAGVFDASTPEEQAKALQAGKFAVDPQYADKLISLISKYNLKQLDKKKTICELLFS